MGFKEKYLRLKDQLSEMEKRHLEFFNREIGIKEKSLVKYDGRLYRVREISVKNNSKIYIGLEDICNFSVGELSFSSPSFSVDYSGGYVNNLTVEKDEDYFNIHTVNNLEYKYHKTHSVSEKQNLRREILNMYWTCPHNWGRRVSFGGYTCSVCGSHTAKDEYGDDNIDINL